MEANVQSVTDGGRLPGKEDFATRILQGKAWVEETRAKEAADIALIGLTPDDTQFVDQVMALWAPLQDRGLEVRFNTGLLVNRRIGNPDKRQPHSGRVIKALSLRLHKSESELSRMRWFAFLFTSFENFRKEFPNVRTWTQVKDLITRLRNGEENDDDDEGGEAKEKVQKATKVLLDKLSDASADLGSEDWKQLRKLREKIGDEILPLLSVLEEKQKELKASKGRKPAATP